ncbi:pyridoxal phosphate-dependent aminotransferase [Pontivivens insulae]|uniref:Histidinol-phosphate aminotransferase n=1 Tax=Pontivivens insulae TaxID=1639689 RepID=A0A2R8AA24_9RHOB|nr:pyridoxal phosphate-dependent aminotransferase [Pontivivens insulae]RED12994.1 histidinol-phosphate aminotransferase [Pontivivens insulae]SPF29087.1 Histidinol-phosphate aminotransferase [Pontivivens insulae]
MTTGPRFTDLAASLPATVPFVGPETQERARGAEFVARLGANENGFGPSPRAIAAMEKAATEIWKYADPESYDLRHALAAHHGISAENIVVGEGIDGLLGYLVRLLVAPGDAVVTSAGAYPTFNYHVAGFGGVIHAVPYRDDAEDPDALIAKAREVDAKLIYFANPDNPMGSWHSADRVQAMIDALPDGCVLCLDEAYGEFAPVGTLPALNVSHPRVIRMRTFSKAYGMAGARVGYALAQEGFATAFNKVRNHFGMNRAAQVGALAALEDQAWLGEVVARVERGRERIAAIVSQAGFTALPSATNFVTVDCGAEVERAKAVLDSLVARGIFIRMPFVAPQNRCVRISVGTKGELDQLEAEIQNLSSTFTNRS